MQWLYKFQHGTPDVVCVLNTYFRLREIPFFVKILSLANSPASMISGPGWPALSLLRIS